MRSQKKSFQQPKNFCFLVLLQKWVFLNFFGLNLNKNLFFNFLSTGELAILKLFRSESNLCLPNVATIRHGNSIKPRNSASSNPVRFGRVSG